MKKTKKLLLNILLISILIMGSLAGGIYLRHIKAEEEKEAIRIEHEKKVNELMALIPARESILVLAKDLQPGSKIEEMDLMIVQFDKDLIPEGALSNKEDVIGKELKIGKTATTIITENDVYEKNNLKADQRERQFSYISLPDKLISGDYVDIRILFPTGQDYIVLSKKRITDLEKVLDTNNTITKQTIWTILDEEEIKRMGSAVVDAYVNGGEIYANEYIEPYLQEAAQVNYPENANVLAYITEDVGIIDLAAHNLEVKLRSDLESSLIQYSKSEDKFLKPIELSEKDIVPSVVTEENKMTVTTNENTAPSEATNQPETQTSDGEETNSFN